MVVISTNQKNQTIQNWTKGKTVTQIPTITDFDELHYFSNPPEARDQIAYRTCSECGGVDRPDFMGPDGHFTNCSKYKKCVHCSESANPNFAQFGLQVCTPHYDNPTDCAHNELIDRGENEPPECNTCGVEIDDSLTD